jgi:hypothetical protein
VNVWISRAGRTKECTGCKQPISTGESIVIAKKYYSADNGKKRTYTFRWHASREQDGLCCWLEDGLLELAKRPRVESRGRKPRDMDQSTRDKRVAVLRRRGSVLQRLKKATAVPPEERDLDEIIRLGTMLEKLKGEVVQLGGVPESW